MSTKFSGSFDEFRLWNKKQTSESIYNNYYRAIGGGANSDDNRTELSVYYKFNEGETETDATDRIVLDYSGRIANGYWEDYSSSNRTTGSAYTTDGDPIIRTSNQQVIDLKSEMELSGTIFDSNNNMSLFDLYPQWIQEEDNGELKKLTQIIAAYFDSLYAKIEYLPKLKDKRYFKDTEKALPFAKRLLEERGLMVPDILVERSILEYFGQRDVNKVEFDKDIEEIKNKIYHNIYNNIEYIYKSKGTEKSYRNLLRCFGIDDEVIKLNLYTDNGVQYLVDKTKHTSEKTKHIDFDEPTHFNATVYQENFISGSGVQLLEKNNAITLEAEVMVPRKPRLSDSWYYNTPFVSSSVFGLDSYDPAYGYGYVSGGIENNFQVYLVRDGIGSDRAKWVLKQKSFDFFDSSNTISGSAISFMTASTANCGLYSSGSGASTSDFYDPSSRSGITISTWFKYEDKSSNIDDIVYLSKRWSSTYSSRALGLRLDGIIARHTDSYGYGFGSGSTSVIPYDFTQHQGEWKHYVLSVSGVVENGVGFDFYVDGVRQTIASTSSMDLEMWTLGDISVGGHTDRSVSGSIDDVLIVNRDITQAEVLDLYNSGYGLDSGSVKSLSLYSDAKAYWTFENSSDSGIGTTSIKLYDEVNNWVLEMFDTGDNPLNFVLEDHIAITTPVAGTTTEVQVLESPFYEDIYNNQRWNIAVKAYPEGYPFAGSFLYSSDPNYKLEFYGVTHNLDEPLHEFKVTATLPFETGSALLSTPKKVYTGARRTNWTGSVEHKSDLKVAAVSLYYDKLDDVSIKQHNLDPSNYGHNRVHSNPTPFIQDMENTHLPAQHSLALHWDFQTVTSSDSSGEFVVEDFSSASSENRYGWLDEVVTNEYKGMGYGFPISSTDVVKNEFIFASKKELPEISFTSDSIQIIGDEENFLYEDEDVNDNVFAFEKSMYQSVSEEMLNMFSTMVEYSNLISKPVDRYRMDYKRLAYARQLFFEKVDGNMDLDRFTDYFKWIDSSISGFLQQLHPANAKFNKGISDMVESHILERPKYQHIYPFVEKQTEIKMGQTKGPGERLYNWRTGHAPNYKMQEYNSKSIQVEASSYLQHGNSSDYSGSNTIAFWFEPNSTAPEGDIITFSTDYKIRFDNSNQFVVRINGSDSPAAGITGVGSKNFVVITKDSNGVVSGSIDGAVLSGLIDGGGDAPFPNNFQIGHGEAVFKIDEVSIWDKVLTDDDVTSIYNGGTAVDLLTHVSSSNLLSYYRMGDHPDDPEIRPFQGYEVQDSTANNNLQVKGTWSSYAEPLAGSFKIERTGENIHCLWQKERKEQSNVTRQFIQKALTTEAQEIELTFGDNDGNSYVGSTYASRRFAKPYRFKGEEQRTIHGGINYAPSKDRDFLKSATHIHGAMSTGPFPVPQEVVTIGAGLAQGLIDQDACDDPMDPTKKQKLASNAVLGKYSDYDGTGPVTGSFVSSSVAEYAYSIKGERILPMNIIEAESTTGFNETIHYNFREGVMLSNLHSDTTSPTNEIPMQGPFTETWVGGRQSRHAPLNRGSDDFTTRPEEWRLLVGEHEVDAVVDGALGFTGPDYGGDDYPNPERAFAIYYRDERAKRPVNVANRRTTDLVQGNFSENYEVVQTVGRLENNKYMKTVNQDTDSVLVTDRGLPATTHEITLLGITTGLSGNIISQDSNRLTIDYTLSPTLQSTVPSGKEQVKSVIASRFSAPGGFDIMSEAYLDAYAKEYSVYNSLNYRNYSVIGTMSSGSAGNSGEEGTIRVNSHNNRREGLNHLHTRHCGQFGIDSSHGTISATDYNAESSFHKIHRNTMTRPTDTGTKDVHNNFFLQSPIPGSDYNYSWVTSSLGSNYSIKSGTQKVYGYWPKTGILSSSSGFDSAIIFPTASEIFGS